jgi:hypothetical protein
MSWFIGYTGDHNPVLEEYLSSLKLDKISEIKKDNFKIICGGIVENLFYNFDQTEKVWIVSGIPIYTKDDKPKFMQKDDLEKLLSKEELNVKDIDGHFAGGYWNNGEIVFFNDQLGLRDIYFLKLNSNYFFSTRLDWVVKFKKENEINIDGFSTNWLLPHQISFGNLIKNVTRLGPGGIIKTASNKQVKNNSSWIPNFNINSSAEEFINALNNFINLSPFKKKKLTWAYQAE